MDASEGGGKSRGSEKRARIVLTIRAKLPRLINLGGAKAPAGEPSSPGTGRRYRPGGEFEL